MSEPRGIVDTLRELGRGRLLEDVQAELRALVTAVRATGGKGTLTVTLTVQPVSKADPDVLMIDDDVTVKAPKPKRAASVLYSTAEGALSRKDPRQPELAGLRVPAAVAHMVPASGEGGGA